MKAAPSRHSGEHTRRGTAVLAMVVVMALITLALIATGKASAQDAQIGLLRVQTIRAFYAAESGGVIVAKGLSGGPTPPVTGDSLNLGSNSIQFVQVPVGSGVVIVEGRSGFARRRLSLTTE